MLIVRAVAVGRDTVDLQFDAQNPIPAGVRPYIRGLVDWLGLAPNAKKNPESEASVKAYKLGTDYKIEYKEREVQYISDAFADAQSDDVLFCMSTFVGFEALKWRESQQLETPIVVITSNPSQFDGKTNICGVSALRPQLASVGIRKFKKAQANLAKIYLLHRQGYGPSDQAKKGIGGGNVALKSVRDNDDPSLVVSQLRSQVPANQVHGLFVLPADRFFGWADDIQAAANAPGAQGSALKTFWSTTDWPTNSFGGYGFPQIVCGRYMAERVASIWDSPLGHVPDPAFITVDPGEIRLKPAAARHKRSHRGPARKK